MKKKETFKSPYDQYKDKNGLSFEILKVINEPDDDHDEEVLPMYLIQFEGSGDIIEAWPEEIYDIPIPYSNK